jgi:DNA-binding transcriptional regulator YhcF (GntR family)
MNIYTRQIAALLNIDLNTALRVQNEMECNGFDFSEATDRQFKREAKFCYETINA